MRKKGKQKERLFRSRRLKKLQRRKQKRTYRPSKSIYRNTDESSDDIVGSNYKKVLKCLEKSNFVLPKLQYRPKQVERIRIPEVFSIAEDPETVIRFLRRMYTIGKGRTTKEIKFEHADCKRLGLSASTIFDIIVLAIDHYRDVIGKPLDYSGDIPKNKFVKDILLASGLPYHLKAEYAALADEEHMERFETVSGVYDRTANKADTIATKLTEYFNRCLKTQNYELNDRGLSRLSNMLGEVVTNCEIHGGEESTWYTQGHYQIQEDDSYGEMQLLFLNIGSTIYEGMKNHSSEETKIKIRHIMGKQRNNIDKTWTEEMIYTLFALQEGVSRLRDEKIEGYSARGSGTVNLIESFYDIGECDKGLKPQMSILSGSTQIIFTDKYKLEDVFFETDDVFQGHTKIIAFNEQNDIYQKADPDNVKKLNEYFPGTVISLKFYLDKRFIARRKADK